ncbi:T9SS type A sorting domain-containing protein [Fibrella forsythiae]|uniref:T9SS type A sorting domain-containing protein n=1 Tax=Fibrella forsythiae TaxID=2817061 RepID=A0ABS3JJX9_9BACT|nr:T9SS type A sorting domain-containing protein [Fibrella forsythiae]MBO0950314.1 T9SS type A sorting domain-containing protein [Fibrella forsythiae]
MKFIYSLLLCLITCIYAKAQQAEMFQTYAVINVDGNESYRAGGINAAGSNTFNNSTYGSANSFITLKGGQIKTYKNNGGDVTGARLYYRVYPAGSPAGTFTLVNLPFGSNLNGSGDQLWENTGANINLASGLPAGNYTIEVYWQITTNLGDRYDSNGGANFTATFTVTSTTLPVNLVSFNAKASNLMASLDWSTVGETGNAYFDVERSTDAQSFTWVGRVAGQGTATARQQYAFTDETPIAGATYYRLKQVDTDGKFSYSPIRVVIIRSNGELTILGNPVSNDLNVSGLIAGSTAELLDLNGQVRHQQTITADRMQTDVRSLPVGTYLLRVIEPTGTFTKRVLIAR